MADNVLKPEQDTEADDIRHYQADIKAGAEYLKQKFIPRAERMVNLYKLNHYYNPMSKGLEVSDEDRIKVAYPFANARQILGEVYVKAPDPIVKPTKPNYVDPMTGVETNTIEGAKKRESILQYITRMTGLKREGKMMGLDGIVTGVGCIRLSGQRKSKLPLYERIIAHKELVWSPMVTNIYKSSWVAQKLVRLVDDAKNDPNYNKNKTRLEPNAQLDKAVVGELATSKYLQYVTLWEIWDKKNDRHMIYPDGQVYAILDEKITGKFNFRVEEDEFETDWPYVFFINEEIIDESFGLGDIAAIESQVRELDKTRTQQINHRARFNRKYGVKKNTLSEQGKNQLKHGGDGAIVEFETDIIPSNFQPIVDAPLSADTYRVDEIIQRDIEIVSPLGPNSLTRGVGKAPDTLGQAQIIEENSNVRLKEKSDNLSDTFSRLFKLTAEFVETYWVEEDDFLVTGDGTKETDWLHFSPEEIKGQYSYDVDQESFKDNSTVYRKQAADALSIVGPLLPQIDPMNGINGLSILVRKYLDTFDWPDVDKILPEPAMAGANPMDDLLSLVQNSDPGQFSATVQGLPPDQQQVIMQQIQTMQGGAPSAPNMAGAASRIGI